MARRGPWKLQRIVVAALGLLAALTALLGWIHRTDLAVLWRWHQVHELDVLRGSNPGAFQLSGVHRMSEFDVLVSRLIRLGRPDFLGGRGFELVPIRSEEGEGVQLTSYEPLEVPFDDPEGPHSITCYFDGCTSRGFLALDGSGRVLGGPFETRVLPGSPVLVEEPGRFTTYRIPFPIHCRSCTPGFLGHDLLAFSIDRRGLVPRGRITSDALAAPVCPTGSPHRPGWTRGLGDLLGSPLPGDRYRALALIEAAGPVDAWRAEPLLEDPDPWLRARAAAILGQDVSFAPRLAALLRDPDPRVRFAAVTGAGRASGRPGWEEDLLPLASGPDRLVALRAHRDLIHSARDDIARTSLIELLRARDEYANDLDLCSLATPEAAAKAVEWLEAEPHYEPRLSNLEVNLRIAFPAEVLRPFRERLVQVLQRRVEGRQDRRELAGILVRLEDPLADAALLETLSGSEEDDGSSRMILLGFHPRETPLTAAGARKILAETMRTGRGCREYDAPDCQRAAALLLARSGSWEAFFRLARNPGNGRYPYEDLLDWIRETFEGGRRECREVTAMYLRPRL